MPDPNNIISPELGLAWFGICKNANSSIKVAFLDALGKKPETSEHEPGLFWYASKEEIDGCGLRSSRGAESTRSRFRDGIARHGDSVDLVPAADCHGADVTVTWGLATSRFAIMQRQIAAG